MKSVMLVDANSVGFAAQNGTELSVDGRPIQAVYGFLQSIRNYKARFPGYELIVLWDGKAQWRYDLYPGYKDRTGKDSKSDAMREAYKQQAPEIIEALELLGVRQVTDATSEADDLAEHFSAKFQKAGCNVVLITGDQDWLQLLDERISWYEHRKDKLITLKDLTDETGYLTTRAFVEGKALTGDTSDTIKGVGGIGKVGAPEFIAEYGSVEEFFRKADNGELPKKLGAVHTRFANNECPPKSDTRMRDAYYRNLKLMDLSQAPKPNPATTTVNAGKFDQGAFQIFCEDRMFNSFLRDFDNWVAPFKR